MTVFVDTFSRADGPIGNNWNVGAYTVTIVSGLVGATSAANAFQTTVSSLTYQRVTAQIYWNSASGYHHGPMVKADLVTRTGNFCYITYTAPTATLYVIGSTGVLVTQALATVPPPYITLSIEWNQGHIKVWLGTGGPLALLWEGDDNGYASNLYAGLYLNRRGDQTDSVTIETDSAAGLAVDPDVIGNYGDCTELTLTGTNTAWTPGTPGSPVFTVDHGTISTQTITSATSATITYCPGDYLGAIVFTDPSTGATAGAVVTSDPTIVPPTGTDCRLTEDGAATINRAEVIPGLQTVLTDLSVVIPGALGQPDLTMLNAIWQIWLAHYATWSGSPPSFENSYFGQILAALMGSYTPTVQFYEAARQTSIRQELEGVTDRLSTLIGAEQWTLDDLLHNLGGVPLANHQDILAAIAALPPGSNQDVLDMLEAMWGASHPTLTDIATLISDISTIAGYTLADVLDAIAAQDVAGARAAILAAIAAMRGDELTTLSGVSALLTDVHDVVHGLKTSLDELRTPSAYTIQDILDAIAAIGSGGGGGTPGAPVWPGEASVTLGAATALSTGLTITAPMDGVVVAITSVAPRLNGHFYTYDDAICYRNVGALAFFTDRGDVETYQALGFTTALYTPRYIGRAGGVKLMCPAGTVGTVRPWTINP